MKKPYYVTLYVRENLGPPGYGYRFSTEAFWFWTKRGACHFATAARTKSEDVEVAAKVGHRMR